MRHWLYKLLCKDDVHPKSHKNPLGVALTIRSERGRVDSLKGHYTQKSIGLLQKLWYQNSTHSTVFASAVVVHAAAARPAVPSVNSRPLLIPCRSLHFLEHSARRRAVCTVCLFLPATAKVIPVSPVISGHHSLNFRTTLSWTLQQFRLF